jgi:16S rRNA C1402 N4-methylase RsmH
MARMKNNNGKKLKDGVKKWKRLDTLKKDGNLKSVISVHSQYNRYIRDFFADNPDASLADARRCWKLKRQLPMEKHKYERSDLKLK